MTTATDFVPADLDGSRWENLEPLYAALLARPVESAGDLEALLLDRSELDAAASEAHANLYIRMTCHSSDAEAKRGYLAFVEGVAPQLKKASFDLDKKIAECPYRDELDADRYGVLLRDTVADVELFRQENVPLQTEDTKLGQQYAETCGEMTVEFDGAERTLPQMGVYLEKSDRGVRESAWRAVTARRMQDRDRFEDIFDEMLAVRGKIAANAGFENYRDYMFKAKHRFDYTPDDCAAFHAAAEQVCVPLYRRFNGERAKALGVDPLRPWDLAVDVKGRSPLRPFADADELVEKSSRLFHRMGSGLGDMFDRLRDGRSLDLESRKGKAPGGYQESRDRERSQFIFMNAAGLQRDLSTMIHEAGHAFHSMLSKDEPLVHYRHPPLEFAEVASMGMELLAYPYYDEFYDAEEAARAKRQEFEDLTRTLSWVATVDAFQHWLYTNPGHSREERAAHWLELDRRFGAAVSWKGLDESHAYSWHRQLHIFEVPFYYIEYGIAQLGALQLWLQSRQDPARALANYKEALALGGSRPLPELFEAAGLKFDFGPATVAKLMDAVSEEVAALPA